MTPSLGERIRELFGSDDKLGLELVMTANVFAAVGVAVVAGVTLHGTFGALCVVTVGAFVALTACLLSRFTVWIAAVLGSLMLAVGPAAALGLATEDLPGEVAA